MTRQSAVRFFALAALLCSSFAAAQDLDAAARELMVRSGLDKQLEGFPGLVQLGMQQAQLQQKLQPPKAGQLTDAQLQTLVDATGKAFDPAAMKTVVLARFKAGLTLADISGALAWLNSPLGRRITQLEEEVSTAEAYAAMQAWAANLVTTPPSDSRLARVRRLDKAVHATEFSMNSMLNSQMAIVAAITAPTPVDNQRRAYDAVMSAYQQNKAQIEASARQQVTMSMLYTYRSLTDAEFDQYLAFAESPAGRKYGDVALKALDEAIVQASRSAGKVFGEALRRNEKPA